MLTGYGNPRQPTAAQLNRLRWCRLEGHGWPPLRETQPGDEHWCEYCGARRVIADDGRALYEWEWE